MITDLTYLNVRLHSPLEFPRISISICNDLKQHSIMTYWTQKLILHQYIDPYFPTIVYQLTVQ